MSVKNGLYIDKHGTKRLYKDGVYHRIGGPAIEYADGSYFWYLNGMRHRIDGPSCKSIYGPIRFHMYGILIEEKYFYRWSKNIPLVLWIRHNYETNSEQWERLNAPSQDNE